jgi:pyruvate formate lyase activating enzyme
VKSEEDATAAAEITAMPARITDISRFATHDGPGIRTTVFLKGCPLQCAWCHNPETISPTPEIGYVAKKCIACGECVRVCEQGAHHIEDGRHLFDRSVCVACGACADACLGGALTLYGREMSADEILAIILEDRTFYDQTGGGLTLSGGEPLLQADFCAELLDMAQRAGLHTAVDTCGMVPWEAFEQVLPVTDIFLYDLKHTDAVAHEHYTGMDNTLILANLRRLSESGAAIEIRIPQVPGFNDDQRFRDEADALLSGLAGIREVKRLPYNPYARSKYEAVGRTAPPPFPIP